jgi:hypothetical protein
VEVFDLQGCMVFTEFNPAATIDLSFLPSGVYLLKVIADKEIFQQKLIKN